MLTHWHFLTWMPTFLEGQQQCGQKLAECSSNNVSWLKGLGVLAFWTLFFFIFLCNICFVLKYKQEGSVHTHKEILHTMEYMIISPKNDNIYTIQSIGE
jgi:hypothetical protein